MPCQHLRLFSWAVAHYHLKKHAPKQVAVNKAGFDKVKGVLFYMIIKEFQPKYFADIL